jgi:hypothetical protein
VNLTSIIVYTLKSAWASRSWGLKGGAIMSLTRALKALGLLLVLGLVGSANAAPAPPANVYCCGLSGGCQLTPSDQCQGTKWSTLSACAKNCL